MGYIQVGIAFSKPRGNRCDEYAILKSDLGYFYTRYVGYRETREDGVWMVGLPLAGPNAAWAQPLIDFVETHFEKVNFFAPK